MEFITEKLANKLTDIATRQFKTGFDFKKNRMEDIRKSEEFYYGRKIVVPSGHFGVPLPTMSGFVDTLMSKIDDPPTISFKEVNDADFKKMRKVSQVWQQESSPQFENWARKDRWTKKLATFSGRGTNKLFVESDPKYKSHFETVDHEDFICEPMGGGDLNKHLFMGQDNIFRTKETLETNARAGLYHQAQVRRLLRAVSNNDFKNNEIANTERKKRYSMLGLNIENNEYVGQTILKLVEWVMNYEGKYYYLLFDYRTSIWVRAHELTQVFKGGKVPYVSWATHEDAFNFWSKAPCDDMLPVADSIDVLFNQALENRQKRNFGQRAYDPDIFPDPSELAWRPDGLVMAKASQQGKNIAQGVYEFQTPEVGGTIDMIAFLDNFAGRKTGITPEAQGMAEGEQKVGIYFGNLQQIADRLGLYNKSYRGSYVEDGTRYYDGTTEHMTEAEMIEMIGEDGAEWGKLKKEKSSYKVELKGGAAEVAANESKAQKRAGALQAIGGDEELRARVNPQWRLQQILVHGGFEDTDVQIALSKEDTVDKELLSEASKSIQEIMAGKEPELNRGANMVYIQKILDFAMKKDITEEQFVAFMKYIDATMKFAQENMARQASEQSAMPIEQAQGTPQQPRMDVGGKSMPEPTAGQTAGVSSQQASSLLRGK